MKIFKSVITGTAILLAAGAFASGDHAGGHGGGHSHPAGPDPSRMPGMSMGHDGAHRHSSWVTPPADYAGRSWTRWDDKTIAARGEELFEQNCAACHGESGRGDGPAAAGLAHKPADLTNNFHTAPGKGDDYLFWRISEGGQVSPFREMQSAMPPFKRLSEEDRWAILTFVHQRFHGGFPAAPMQNMAKAEHDHDAGPDEHDESGQEENGMQHAHAETGHGH